MRNKFRKQERIVSQKLIDQLFGGKDSRSLSAFPLRAVYMKRDNPCAEAPVQILVSVPKRHLKHAVDRNRVKRQVREAYRLQKDLLPEGQSLALAFIWQTDRCLPSAEVDSRVKSLLERIARRL
ncbi:MAG: ribonuclease P protein component [Prevotella sp.]|nr:ribonuclease P protein component [Prevotella sp.]